MHNYHGVPALRDNVRVGGTRILEMEVNIVGRCSCNDWPLDIEDVSRHDFGFHSIVIGVHGNVIRKVFLVLGLTELVTGIKIYPKLEAQRRLFKAVGHFGMDDAFTCGHPLYVSRSYRTLVSLEIFVSNLSIEHVRDGLEASVWMVWEACWQLHIKEVKHEERI